MSEKLGAEQGRCNRCQANLCDHDNCTDWTCARACSKCAKGPCHENSSAELTALRAAAASQGVNLTKANIAGYVKGFKAAQEYEKLGAEQGGLELERRCNYYFGGYDGGTRCQKLKGHDGAHLWESDTEQLLSSAISQLTEQAYHARGAGREPIRIDGKVHNEGDPTRTITHEFHLRGVVFGEICWRDKETIVENAIEPLRAEIIRLRKLLVVRESGADTGTTPDPDPWIRPCPVIYSVQSAGSQIAYFNRATAERFIAERKEPHKFTLVEYVPKAAAERGTTPPEGLAMVRKLYEHFQGPHACGDFTCDCGRVEVCGLCAFRVEVEDWLRGAATQRAPVEQGRERMEYDLLWMNCISAAAQATFPKGMHPADELKLRVEAIASSMKPCKLTAPDHAREGALRVRVEALLVDYRDILASLKTTMEQHRERVSGFTTLEAYRHHIDCTEIVVIKLERALADGKEGGE